MRRTFSLVLGASLLLALGAAGFAQRQRVSPHEKVEATVGGKKIVIEYGRPSLKGRELSSLAPEGKVWRTGADEATTLMVEGDVMLGSLHVPAGTYSLFTVPGAEWTLVVNKVAKQWGAFKYDEKMDLGRVKMKSFKPGSPAEMFTIAVESKGGSNAELKMMWGTAGASVPVMMH